MTSQYTFSLYGVPEKKKFIISERRVNLVWSKIDKLKLPYVNLSLDVDDILCTKINYKTHGGCFSSLVLNRSKLKRPLSSPKFSVANLSFLLCQKLFPDILKGKFNRCPGVYCVGGRERIKSFSSEDMIKSDT